MCSGTIGEYFVICELLRNRYEVTTSPNHQNKDWDILIIKKPNGQKIDIKLQVKAVTWPAKGSSTKPVITGNFNGNFDYLVVVVIGFYRVQKYAVYVIPKTDLNQATGNARGGLPSTPQQYITFSNSTIPFSTFKNVNKRKVLNKKYRNNWQQI